MSMDNTLLTDLLAEVSIAPMMAHLTEFSRWKKLAGTHEEAESLKYVRACLDGYGFTTKLLFHDAFISLPLDAYLELNGIRVNAITHSMALPTPTSGLSGSVVDLRAASQEAFDSADLRGQIVVIDGMATPEMTKRCRLAGVAAQIHISPHEHLHEMCLSCIWGNPSTETIKDLPTTSVITISFEDGEMLRKLMAETDSFQARIFANVDTGWRKTPILIADLQAESAPKDSPYIMFSGHHDTWYEGVMDNGSANATMLEVARCLAPKKDQFRRHLRLCFWSGHSQGRYSGSAWYADNNWHEIERDCAVHVNVDSTGGQGNLMLSQAPAATELSNFAQDVIHAHSGQDHAGVRNARNSDQSFWGIGIPSLFGILSCQPIETRGVRNALGWWWHTPHDKLDRIDPDLLIRDTQIYVHAVGHLLTSNILPLSICDQVADLKAHLSAIRLPKNSGVPLDRLLNSTTVLEDALMEIKNCPPKTAESCLAHDRMLMRISREIVPFDYSTGDRHNHDPALQQKPWPSLDPLRHLELAEPSSPDFLFATGPAVRSANKLLSALINACAIAKSETSN